MENRISTKDHIMEWWCNMNGPWEKHRTGIFENIISFGGDITVSGQHDEVLELRHGGSLFCVSVSGLTSDFYTGPSGNQTWRAGKWTIYRWFSYETPHLYGLFRCHVWLPERIPWTFMRWQNGIKHSPSQASAMRIYRWRYQYMISNFSQYGRFWWFPYRLIPRVRQCLARAA